MDYSSDFLTTQLITYIGNKRKLLPFIDGVMTDIKKQLGKENPSMLDGFSGSGAVARLFKHYASTLLVNDLELYSQVINRCYLSQPVDVSEKIAYANAHKLDRTLGLIENFYAPMEDEDIKPGERVFYTLKNARIIDNIRRMANEESGLNEYLLAPLLVQASIHANTSGVFKGFYKNKAGIGQFGGEGKNALPRIKGEITLEHPVFLDRPDCEVLIHREDTNELVKDLAEFDIAYYDPPYDQHPYGSNYFMLNLICEYKRPEKLSKVSGIVEGWNRSAYNKKLKAETAIRDLVQNTPAKFVVIRYSNEGLIDMRKMLSDLGQVSVVEQEYSAFKGSRNLASRSLSVREQLWVIKK